MGRIKISIAKNFWLQPGCLIGGNLLILPRHYLSKALNLSPVAKASSVATAPEDLVNKGELRHEKKEHKRHHGGERARPRSPRGGGDRRPRTPDREPLQRKRPQAEKREGKKKRRRGTGGKAKRQRGQDWKAFVEERKRKRQEDAAWRQRGR